MQIVMISLLWYVIAYLVTTVVGILHTVFNIVCLKMTSMHDGPGMGEGYEATKPWHPLYNLIIFPLAAYGYFISVPQLSLGAVIGIAFLWGILTMVIDLFGWVLIKHPWALTAKEFYVDYQPWISLIYLAIFLSPFIAYFFIK